MKIFLAAPFTQYISSDGVMAGDMKELLLELVGCFRDQGWRVFLAHEREDWGRSLYPPETCTPLDLEEMRTAEVVVCIPGTSGGVHVELGWASALRKPILLLLEEGRSYSPLVQGLHEVTPVRRESLNANGLKDRCLRQLKSLPW